MATTTRHRSVRRRSLISWPLYRLLMAFALVILVVTALAVAEPSAPTPPVQPLTVSGAAMVKDAIAFQQLERSTRLGCCTPGSSDELAGARWVANHLKGFDRHPQIDQFATQFPWRASPVAMVNVVAYARGSQPGVIAVIAHRDGAGADPAAGTAMLVALSRALAPLQLRRGIVLVSTDGGTTGGQGADHFAHTWPFARHIVAAIVLDSVGAPPHTRFSLLLRSQSPRGTSPTLVAALRGQFLESTGLEPALPGAYDQLSGYAIPYAPTEQGPLLARGLPAVAVSGGPLEGRPGSAARLDPGQLSHVGAAVANTVAALDAAPSVDTGGPPAIFLGDRVVQGWLVQVSLTALLAPVVACVLDLVAGLRRRRLPLAAGVWALAWRSSAWLAGLILLWVLTLVPGRLFSPVDSVPLPGRTAVTTAGLFLWLGLWLLYWRFATRPRLVRMGPVSSSERTAGLAAGLVGMAFAAVLLAAVNPFALIIVLPAAHAWLWLATAARAGRRAMALVWLAGLLGPLLALLELWYGQGLGSQAPRALIAMVASGYMSQAVSVCLALFCAAGCQLASLVLGRYAPAHRWTVTPGRGAAPARPRARGALTRP